MKKVTLGLPENESWNDDDLDATHTGPEGATLKYNSEGVDPWSISGQQAWDCAAKEMCDWPYWPSDREGV